MIGDEIPDQDHVLRYVKPSLLDGTYVDGGAFLLRGAEFGLSVNWLEIFENDSHTDPVSEIRRLSRISLASTGKFAKLNVSQTRQYVSAAANEAGISLDLSVVETPYPARPTLNLIPLTRNPRSSRSYRRCCNARGRFTRRVYLASSLSC